MTTPPTPPVLPDGQTFLGFDTDGAPRILRHHKSTVCAPPCAIHTPSDHPLNAAPVVWRGDRGILERRCEHSYRHPDPDGLAYLNRNKEVDSGVHGCDGCCSGTYIGNAEPTEQPATSRLWTLTVANVAWFVGDRDHYIIEFSPNTGFHIRAIHAYDECDDEHVFTYSYARAILDPPPHLPASAHFASDYFQRHQRMPLVTTCDVNDGALLIDDNYWEPSFKLPEFGDYITRRAQEALCIILNDMTKYLRK